MPTLAMMKGLPGSGKSTYAKTLVDEGFLRLSLDDLRASMHNGWTKANEQVVQAVEEQMAHTILGRGFNVVVDDTNVTTHHYNKWSNIAEKHGAIFTVYEVNTPIEECIRRDRLREGPARVGWEVIYKLNTRWESMPEV